VRILKNVEERPPRVVESLGLTSEAAAISFIVNHDMERSLALIAKPFIELGEITHYVDKRAPPLFSFCNALLEQIDLLAKLHLCAWFFTVHSIGFSIIPF